MAHKISTLTNLERRAFERRAIEAVIWGMPVVNYELMYQALRRVKGDFNQIVYWSSLPDWKNQTLTPNPDAIYLMPFFNTKDAGPMVLVIPPADGGRINGSVMDCWQAAFEDVGPAGVDKGKGAKYLILPPNYTASVPDGFVPMPSGNYQGYALLRSILESGSPEHVAKAVRYAKRIRLYPLSEAAKVPETTFIDSIDTVFDSTIPYDLRFFQSLDRMVQAEPWLTRDKVMIAMLQSIGIEKGKPFKPDASRRRLLERAASQAHDLLDARYDAGFLPFDPKARWALPASPAVIEGLQSNFANPDQYPTDGRGLAYSLHVPPDAPVDLYWSATVYDRETHALIRKRPWASRSSQTPGLQSNADGSVDVYFGPKAPAGSKSNWVPTRAGARFEVLFRLYGPKKRFFEKKWILPDIQKV